MTDNENINEEKQNLDETNDENVRDTEIVNLGSKPKNPSNSIDINLEGISKGFDIIAKSSPEKLKNILENSRNSQDNHFKLLEEMINKAIPKENIELIVEFSKQMQENTKEEHEHARKVQQEDNRHDEAMADKWLTSIGIIAGAILVGAFLSSNDNNNGNNSSNKN